MLQASSAGRDDPWQGASLKIVITDTVLFPEDCKKDLGTLGDLVVFESAPASSADLSNRVQEAQVVLLGKAAFTRETFAQAKSLKMICVCHTGFDNVDLRAATDHGVIVSNVPAYASEAVAEFVFALALDLLRKIQVADILVRKGEYDCHYYLRNRLLADETLGVVGLGNIGRKVTLIAHAFGMNVLSTTAHPESSRANECGVTFLPLRELLSLSDIVTLHVPLTPETEHLIGAEELRLMKPTAILINTSRGEVVDGNALVDALVNQKIAGAALDVFDRERLPPDSPLTRLENVLLTPHIAYLSDETIRACAKTCVENVRRFLQDEPQNVVNPEVLGRTTSR